MFMFEIKWKQTYRREMSRMTLMRMYPQLTWLARKTMNFNRTKVFDDLKADYEINVNILHDMEHSCIWGII